MLYSKGFEEDALQVKGLAGFEKPLSGHPGQVHFPAGQLTFLVHVPMGQIPRQA